VDSREGPQLAPSPMTDADARLWHPWLRLNRVLRVMLHTRWSAEAWAVVRVEFRKALALPKEWFRLPRNSQNQLA